MPAATVAEYQALLFQNGKNTLSETGKIPLPQVGFS